MNAATSNKRIKERRGRYKGANRAENKADFREYKERSRKEDTVRKSHQIKRRI
jgi:hypothetical protein